LKKVLIITYYWPPCGGIGVLRCLKFAKYLRAWGWEPVIFTADGAHYPSIDHSNDKDIPEGITILRQPIWEPYHLYKFITGQKKDANVNNVFYASEKKRGLTHNISVWLRSNFFIPDARAAWIDPSVKFLLKYLKAHPVDALLSNGPPHSNTRIATLLKKATGIPWLADFQDPWSQVDYFGMLKLTRWGRHRHLRMEQEVFRHADAITIVSDRWKKDLEKIGAKNVTTVAWGYDPDDFRDLPEGESEHFSITHTGILGTDRHPALLLNAIQDLKIEMPGIADDLRIQLAGLVDTGIRSDIENRGLQDNVVYLGSMERRKALELTVKSKVLLLILNRQENAAGRIPGKFFEYMAAGRPIFCIGPAESDVRTIMEAKALGYYCPFDDAPLAKSYMKELYEKFLKGSLGKYTPRGVEEYSNYNLTAKISGILNSITERTVA
ncbi:MAG TPA: glycosyltransferase, partial [Phnomibacter sp.]|nr:glycosyltransferase [Phnomibacter sp.]